jgi:hypothetical protein
LEEAARKTFDIVCHGVTPSVGDVHHEVTARLENPETLLDDAVKEL